MDKNQVFKCSVCNKSYSDAMDRARCELSCCKKLAEEAKKAEEMKKMEEQKTRKTEVDNALKIFVQLARQYVKDYGYYEYDKELFKDSLWLNKLCHYFLI